MYLNDANGFILTPICFVIKLQWMHNLYSQKMWGRDNIETLTTELALGVLNSPLKKGQ